MEDSDRTAQNNSAIQNSVDSAVNAENSPSEQREAPDFSYQASPNLSREASNQGQQTGGKFKKYGPAAMVFGLVAFVGITMSLIMTPSLAIQHFATMLENRFNTQNVFMEQRTNQMAIDKIKGAKMAELDADHPEILTSREERFTSMPEDMATRIKDSGINSETNISMEEYYRNPTYRRQLDSVTLGSYGRSIDAATYKIKIITGSYFAGLRSTLKIGEKILSAKESLKNTFNRSVANEIDPKAPQDINRPVEVGRNKTEQVKINDEKTEIGTTQAEVDDLNNSSVGDKNSGTSATKKGATAQSVLKAGAIVDKILSIVNQWCSIYEFMSSVNSVLKTENLYQLVRFAIVFMSTADRIKNGTATEEEISYIGDKLLDLVVTDQGLMKTALESTSVIYADQKVLPHNINEATDPSVVKFQGGMHGTVADFYSKAKEESKGFICQAIKSPTGKTTRLIVRAGVAIGAIATTIASAFATGGMSLIAVFTGAAASLAASYFMEAGTKAVSDWASREIGASVSKMKVSSDTIGEDVGNAVAAGLGAHHARISAQSGGGILSLNAALSYNHVNEKLLALKAEDERLNRSPFDASSPYTFLGNIISKMWPYWSRNAGIMTKINTSFKLFSSSFSSLFQPKQASALMAYATSKQAYTQCKDPDYTDLMSSNGLGGAFDIFCNPIHGIPVAALFTSSQAAALNLDAPSVLVAENGNVTSSKNFVGEKFSWQNINKFLLENNDTFFFFDEEGRINKGKDEKKDKTNAYGKKKKKKSTGDPEIDEKGSELWRYYKNCINRANIPFGNSFAIDEENSSTKKQKNGEVSRNSFLMSFFGIEEESDLISDGSECILTNEALVDDGGNYTEMGRKVAYALFFADERAQCILNNDGEECPNLIDINKSDGDSGDGVCILPSDDVDEDNEGSEELSNLVDKGNYALIIPKNSAKGSAVVWLAGSGEKGNNATKYGLPALAQRNGGKYPIIVPYKNTEYWTNDLNGLAKIINDARQTLSREFEIETTSLIGEGFSAGGQGIARLQAEGYISFTTIKLYGSNLGGASISTLSDQLDNRSLSGIEFHVGSADSNFRDKAKSDYEKLQDVSSGVLFKEYDGIGHNIDELYAMAGTGSLNCTIEGKKDGEGSSCGENDGQLNAKSKGGREEGGWSSGSCPSLSNSNSACIWWEDKNKHVMYSDQNQKPIVRLRIGEYANFKVLIPSSGSRGCVKKITLNRCSKEIGTSVSYGNLPSINEGSSECESQVTLPSPVTINWTISGNHATDLNGVESSLLTSLRLEGDSALKRALNSSETKVVPRIQVIVDQTSSGGGSQGIQTIN